MRFFLGRGVVSLALALMAGCASIPLSTMWKMRNFGPEDVLRLDPEALRVAAATSEEVVPDPAKSTLKISLRRGERPEKKLQLSLELAQDISPPDEQLHWIVLKPTATSADLLRQLRDEYRADPASTPDAVDIAVNAGFDRKDMDKIGDTAHFFVALRIAVGEDWLRLIDGAAIPIERALPKPT